MRLMRGKVVQPVLPDKKITEPSRKKVKKNGTKRKLR